MSDNLYHTSQNISDSTLFFLFLQISENMLNFWRGVSIVSSFFYKKSKQARVTTFVRLFLDGATIVKGPGCAEGTHLVSAILR